MAWSQTAPTLPGGGEWSQVGTTSWENNNLKITSVVYTARLNGNGFAVKVVETRQHYRYNQTDLYLRCDIGGVTGTPETGIKGTSGNGSTTAYFTGEAAAGVTVDVVVGFRADISSSLKRVSFTAPALLGSTVYFKVSGVWKQATLYRKGGAWKNALAKFKAGGTWK